MQSSEYFGQEETRGVSGSPIEEEEAMACEEHAKRIKPRDWDAAEEEKNEVAAIGYKIGIRRPRKEIPRRELQRREFPRRAGDTSEITCYFCGKSGHYARDCRKRKRFHKEGEQLHMLIKRIDIFTAIGARKSSGNGQKAKSVP